MFYANYISADRWSGVQNDEEEINSPALDDMYRMIDALNAKDRTLVCVGGQQGSHLGIGGGGGHYVVYISDQSQQLWNLISENGNMKATVALIAGGQDGEYPARQVVDKTSAMKAAESFFMTGERDPGLHWELQE